MRIASVAMVLIVVVRFRVGLAVLLMGLDDSLGSFLFDLGRYLSIILRILFDLVLFLNGLLLESISFLRLIITDELGIGQMRKVLLRILIDKCFLLVVLVDPGQKHKSGPWSNFPKLRSVVFGIVSILLVEHHGHRNHSCCAQTRDGTDKLIHFVFTFLFFVQQPLAISLHKFIGELQPLFRCHVLTLLQFV